MFIKTKTRQSTGPCSARIERLGRALAQAGAVVIGAGAGLSASAGMTYAGPRFEEHFADFIAKYHFPDMYTAGFYPYASLEEYWAYWSRHIYWNRYDQPVGEPYRLLLELVREKDYFVVTTNVDHCFQQAGFDKRRLFYMQGDYGLWQCARPCHQKTYDNEAAVRRMLAEQTGMRIPAGLVPRCPICGAPMAMNLRCDGTFVQDEGWYAAQSRYAAFINGHEGADVLYLELGVGGNTPSIIRNVFPVLASRNPHAFMARVNLLDASIPEGVDSGRSVSLYGDCGQVIQALQSGLTAESRAAGG